MKTVDLEKNIAGYIEAYRSEAPNALIDALLYASDPSRFRSLVQTTLNDDNLLDTAVHRSSIHNNGFLKIILLTSPDYQVRLHVWDCRSSEFGTQEENIHTHTADFSSMIIVGSYRHEQFREAGRGESFHSYSYHATRGSRSFSLTSTGTTRLQRVSDQWLPRKTIYSFAGDILHRVIPSSNALTASLVIQGPARYSFVQVLADKELDTESEIPVRPLSKEKLVAYASEIIADPTTFS